MEKVTNEYEAAARASKAFKLRDVIDTHLDALGVTGTLAAHTVAGMSDAAWDALDVEADLKHPSSEFTRAVVRALYVQAVK